MENQQHGISPHTVQLPFHCLKQMIQLVRDLQNLSENPAYPPLLNNLPENALVDPGYFSVLMGYDLHIDETQQVKLIEVNTNAGGLWYAARSYAPDAQHFPKKLADKLLTKVSGFIYSMNPCVSHRFIEPPAVKFWGQVAGLVH
jgi:hypothetical protein